MAGNSQRRGRTSGAGKKTATAGTGGKNRRSLAGRGATPPAEARPGHPAQRRAAADARQRADRSRARQRAEETAGAAARPQPGGRGAARGDPGDGAVRRHRDTGAAPTSGSPRRSQLAGDRGLPLLEVGKAEFDRMSNGALHQGIGLQVPPYDYAHPDDLVDRARDAGGVAADRGDGRRHRPAQPGRRRALGGGVRRARRRRPAAPRGGHDRLGVAHQRGRRRPAAGRAGGRTWPARWQSYQQAGLQTVGLAGDGDVELQDYDGFADPLALVVGAEGTGLSRLVRERCDVVVRIPISQATESLNVSVAASIALYEVARARR